MNNNNTIKKVIRNSYLYSMITILLSIYIVIFIVFMNWEVRRVQSEINQIVFALNKTLDFKDNNIDEADPINLIKRKIDRFRDIEGSQSTTHIKLFYDDHLYSSDNYEIVSDYKDNIEEFQIIIYKNNILILKNLLFEFGEKKVYIQIYSDSSEIKKDLNSLLKSLFLSSIFIILISLALVRKIDKIIRLPIQEITKTTKEINRYDLSKRIHIINPKNELGKLSMLINEMIHRLEISFNSQSRFISNASHELRTPLAVIKGYADLLNAGAKDDPVMLDKGITEIIKEVNNMEKLLQKLLFLARKESETLKSEIIPTDISKIVKELVEKQQLIDQDHKYELIRNKASTINLDKDLILQSLRELLKNSSKYTPSGEVITIDSFRKKKFHYIIIKNPGKGIPKENLKYVFDRFYIQDKSRNRQKNSFGLGLSIVKDIVKLHNGNINITSEIDKETVVTIELPVVS